MGRDPPTAEHGDPTKFPPVRPTPQGRKPDRWDGSLGGERAPDSGKGWRGGRRVTWKDSLFFPTQSQFLPLQFRWEGNTQRNAAAAILD